MLSTGLRCTLTLLGESSRRRAGIDQHVRVSFDQRRRLRCATIWSRAQFERKEIWLAPLSTTARPDTSTYTMSQKIENQKVLAFTRVISGNTDLADLEVSIRWDERQERVGLFLRGVQWVAFVAPVGAKHGGNFGLHANTDIPAQQKFDA
jgi:hypothetical protein